MRTTWLDTELPVYEMVKRTLKVNYPLKCQWNMVSRKQFKTLSLFKRFYIIVVEMKREKKIMMSSYNNLNEFTRNQIQQFFDPNICQLFSTELKFSRASQVFLNDEIWLKTHLCNLLNLVKRKQDPKHLKGVGISVLYCFIAECTWPAYL